MVATLRVGIAGAGLIGAIHARAYQRVPGVELVGVADPKREKAEAVAREVDCQPFHDYAALLEADVDILSVCLPTTLHLPAAEAAAQAGAHVMMEKPIARTVEEADRMLVFCQEAGVYLMVGFTHRFYPEMREAKRLISEGRIGKPLSVRDSMSFDTRFVLPWYRDRDVSGGGVFMCNAVHGFDRASWVLDQNITAVVALVEPTAGSRGEDYGSVLARFDGGAQGTFFQHWGPSSTLQCEMQVFGEKGMLHVRSWESVEVLVGDVRTVHQCYNPYQGHAERVTVGMIAELTEMVEAVRESRQPEPSGQAGRTAVALVSAAYQSAETGAWVEVPAE
jgi:UDP-N-acetylglucosamine 3-dehydrogenase